MSHSKYNPNRRKMKTCFNSGPRSFTESTDDVTPAQREAFEAKKAEMIRVTHKKLNGQNGDSTNVTNN